jgi:hypothetical protein
MLAEAANACFYAGRAAEMLAAAEQAHARLPEEASVRAQFLAATVFGMAHVFAGNATKGSAAIHEAIALAEGSLELQEDLRVLPWLAVAPIFLREAAADRPLLEQALSQAPARSAVGALPFVLNLIGRDHATTDNWALAEATYREAIDLARESGQRTDLVFGLAGLACLQARRGRERDCRELAAAAQAAAPTPSSLVA